LSALTTVTGELWIKDNESLCQADAEAFAASIEVGGATIIEGNDETCP